MKEEIIDMEKYNEIIKMVDKKVKKELNKKISKNALGYKHYFDLRKKEILEKEYGIKWKTLQERNEGCFVD